MLDGLTERGWRVQHFRSRARKHLDQWQVILVVDQSVELVSRQSYVCRAVLSIADTGTLELQLFFTKA